MHVARDLPTDASRLGRAVRKKHCRKLMAVKAARRFRSQCRNGSRVRHREANDDTTSSAGTAPGSSAGRHTGSEAGFVGESASAARLRLHPNPGASCMTTGDPRAFMWAEACALIERAERLQRQFFRPSQTGAHHAVGRPPVDIYETERELLRHRRPSRCRAARS